jgi:hypothetical protein
MALRKSAGNLCTMPATFSFFIPSSKSIAHSRQILWGGGGIPTHRATVGRNQSEKLKASDRIQTAQLNLAEITYIIASSHQALTKPSEENGG